MKSGHGGHNAEPETVSGNVTTPFEPIEVLEYVRVLVGGDSRPVISDRNKCLAIAVCNLNSHLTRFMPVLDGVIDEIGDRIEEEISITRDEHSLTTHEAQMPVAFFRGSVEQLYDVTRDLR